MTTAAGTSDESKNTYDIVLWQSGPLADVAGSDEDSDKSNAMTRKDSK
jgi:hypothetical protein